MSTKHPSQNPHKTLFPNFSGIDGLARGIKLAFFVALFVLGLVLYRDYGLHWDTDAQIEIGKVNFAYVFEGDSSLLNFDNRYYGPIFELLLHILTRGMPLRQVHLTRHLCTFLVFFGGVYAFYELTRRITGKWQLGILGAFFLVASPRVFADAFYNSKDVPFMAVFIVGALSLDHYLDDKSFRSAAVHALASALLIALRIPGLLIVGLTLAFLILEILFHCGPLPRLKWAATGLFYLVLTLALVVLFWPVLWHDPLRELVNAFQHMSHYPWLGGVMLYRAQFVEATALPWHYILVWMLITIPLVYSFWFTAGGLRTAYVLAFHPGALFTPEKRRFLMVWGWFLAPVVIVILLHSTLYDGWRQLFFVYPPFLLLTVMGIQAALNLRLPRVSPRLAAAVVGLATIAGLLDPLGFMLRYHPNQNVYFNLLAGETMREVKAKYELDYWGVSYRQGLEFILENDPSPEIRVAVANSPGRINAAILTEAQRKRLVFVREPEEAQYFLTNYRYHPRPYDYKDEVFSVKIKDASILSVFRMSTGASAGQ